MIAKELIVCFLVLFSQSGCMDPGITRAEWRALTNLRSLYEAMSLATKEHEEEILKIENNNWNQMLSFLRNHDYVHKDDPINIDIWGNEIRYILLPKSPGLNVEDRLFVWSFGPNRINEFGHGDDISYFRKEGMSYIKGKRYIPRKVKYP